MLSRRLFLLGSCAAVIYPALPKPSALSTEAELDRAIGANIAILRGDRSRDELAEAVGCSTEFLAQAEAGRGLRVGLATRIADELSIEFSDLLADPELTGFLCELAELESNALSSGECDHDGTPKRFRMSGQTVFYGTAPCYRETSAWLLSLPLECSAVGWAPNGAIWCRLMEATEAEILHAMEERI
jgi:transcriptional regulator with XRE-family HTH domain